MTTIATLQTRYRELGRLRMGQRVPTKSGGRRPEKLETWRFTSTDWRLIQRASELYGGKPERWDDAPSGTRQFQVTTERDWIPVILPPDVAISQALEAWTAAGCVRRCDGQVEYVSGAECLCQEETDDAPCRPTTRLSVLLPDMPGLGVWRLETHGWFAARELVPMVRLASTLGRGQTYRLRIDPRAQTSRQDDGKPVTYHFGVPVLDTDLTPGQLLELEGNGSARAIEGGHGPSDALAGKMMQMSDPPGPVSPPAGDRGGSDPTSEGEGPRGAEAAPGHPSGTPAAPPSDPMSPPEVSTQGAHGGDPTSPDSVRGRQSSGTLTSGAGVSGASGASSPAGDTAPPDPSSAAGLSTASAGVPGDGSPAGSPAADPTSGAVEALSYAGTGAAAPAGSSRAASGDQSPTRPVGQTPGRVGGNVEEEDEQLAAIANRDGPEAERELAAGQTQSLEAVVAEMEAEELRPVFYWCQRNGLDMRLAATYLRRSHKKDFDDVKDRTDLTELAGPRAALAMDLLHQQFVVGRKR